LFLWNILSSCLSQHDICSCVLQAYLLYLCIGARCPPPYLPSNGFVSFRDSKVGDMAEYTCAPGFTVMGPRKRHCLGTLQWSGPEPICTNQTDCKKNNFRYFYFHDLLSVLYDLWSFFCKLIILYYLFKTMQKYKGVFYGEPYCVPYDDCFSPPYIQNAIVLEHTKFGEDSSQERNDYRTGDSITMTCRSGFEDPARKYTTVLCVGNQWKYEKLDCQRKRLVNFEQQTNYMNG
uniref:Sushi domain-containing protein n=1 Tax=Schistocephalus solidus TaxID=70667 RepID=A0A183S7U5_SCHSO